MVVGWVVREGRRENLASSIGRLNIDLTKQLAGCYERIAKLSEVEFVANHLRRFGVGGYLVSANDRIANDIQQVMLLLKCTEDEAIMHIRRGTIGPEPAGVENDRGSDRDGEFVRPGQAGGREQADG